MGGVLTQRLGELTSGGISPPAGPPAYLASGTFTTDASSVTLSVPYPAGIQQYDILILHILALNAASSSTFTTPTGWNLMVRRILGTSEVGYDMVSHWRRCDGTESGSVSVTQSAGQISGGGSNNAIMSAFRGCVSTGTPYEGLASTGNRDNSKLGSAIVTTGADRLVTNLYGCDATAGDNSTPGSGWTERYDIFDTVGADKLMVMDTKAQAVAGSVSAEAPTMNTGATNRWASISFALITQ